MTHMYIGNTCTHIHIAATLMLKKINRNTHAQIKKKKERKIMIIEKNMVIIKI